MYISWFIIVLIILYVIWADKQRARLATAYIKLANDTNRRNWQTREAIQNLDWGAVNDLNRIINYSGAYSDDEKEKMLRDIHTALVELQDLEIMHCYDTNVD